MLTTSRVNLGPSPGVTRFTPQSRRNCVRSRPSGQVSGRHSASQTFTCLQARRSVFKQPVSKASKLRNTLKLQALPQSASSLFGRAPEGTNSAGQARLLNDVAAGASVAVVALALDIVFHQFHHPDSTQFIACFSAALAGGALRLPFLKVFDQLLGKLGLGSTVTEPASKLAAIPPGPPGGGPPEDDEEEEEGNPEKAGTVKRMVRNLVAKVSPPAPAASSAMSLEEEEPEEEEEDVESEPRKELPPVIYTAQQLTAGPSLETIAQKYPLPSGIQSEARNPVKASFSLEAAMKASMERARAANEKTAADLKALDDPEEVVEQEEAVEEVEGATGEGGKEVSMEEAAKYATELLLQAESDIKDIQQQATTKITSKPKVKPAAKAAAKAVVRSSKPSKSSKTATKVQKSASVSAPTKDQDVFAANEAEASFDEPELARLKSVQSRFPLPDITMSRFVSGKLADTFGKEDALFGLLKGATGGFAAGERGLKAFVEESAEVDAYYRRARELASSRGDPEEASATVNASTTSAVTTHEAPLEEAEEAEAASEPSKKFPVPDIGLSRFVSGKLADAFGKEDALFGLLKGATGGFAAGERGLKTFVQESNEVDAYFQRSLDLAKKNIQEKEKEDSVSK